MIFFNKLKNKTYLISSLLLIIITTVMGVSINSVQNNNYQLNSLSLMNKKINNDNKNLFSALKKIGNSQALYSETKIDHDQLIKEFINKDSQISNYYALASSRIAFLPTLNHINLDLTKSSWENRHQKITWLKSKPELVNKKFANNYSENIKDLFKQRANFLNLMKLSDNVGHLSKNFFTDSLMNVRDIMFDFKKPKTQNREKFNRFSNDFEKWLFFINNNDSNKHFENLAKAAPLLITVIENFYSLFENTYRLHPEDQKFNRLTNMAIFLNNHIKKLSEEKRDEFITAFNKNNKIKIDKYKVVKENEGVLEPPLVERIKDINGIVINDSSDKAEIITELTKKKTDIKKFENTLFDHWKEIIDKTLIEKTIDSLLESSLINDIKDQTSFDLKTILSKISFDDWGDSLLNLFNWLFFKQHFINNPDLPNDFYSIFESFIKNLVNFDHKSLKFAEISFIEKLKDKIKTDQITLEWLKNFVWPEGSATISNLIGSFVEEFQIFVINKLEDLGINSDKLTKFKDELIEKTSKDLHIVKRQNFNDAKTALNAAVKGWNKPGTKTIDQKFAMILPILKIIKNLNKNLLANVKVEEWKILNIWISNLLTKQNYFDQNNSIIKFWQIFFTDLKLDTLKAFNHLGFDLIYTFLKDLNDNFFNEDYLEKIQNFDLIKIIWDVIESLGFVYPVECKNYPSEKCQLDPSIRKDSFFDKILNFYDLQRKENPSSAEENENKFWKIIRKFYSKIFSAKGSVNNFIFEIDKEIDKKFYYYLKTENWKYEEEKIDTIFNIAGEPKQKNISYVASFYDNNELLWKYRFHWIVSLQGNSEKQISLSLMEKFA